MWLKHLLASIYIWECGDYKWRLHTHNTYAMPPLTLISFLKTFPNFKPN
jgi:hypothetical protein